MGNSRYVDQIVSHGAETATYLKAYVQKLVEYQKLEATEKASETGAALTLTISTILATVLCLLFLTVAAALWLGNVMESPALGFVCVAGFYLLLVMLIRLLRGSFRTSVQNGIIAFLNHQDSA